MGLDQYWFRAPNNTEKTEALLKGEEAKVEEIGYHRKWHELNEFMGNLWDEYGQPHFGNDEHYDFNCANFPIDLGIIERLRTWHSQQDDVLEFPDLLDSIERYINAGDTVYYRPWW